MPYSIELPIQSELTSKPWSQSISQPILIDLDLDRSLDVKYSVIGKEETQCDTCVDTHMGIALAHASLNFG